MTDSLNSASTHDCEAFRKQCRTNEVRANERANRYKAAALYAYEAQFEGWYPEERPAFEEWVMDQVNSE